MTPDDILRMAREADPFGDHGRLVSIAELTPRTLERFAALVAAAEREECAKVVEDATALKRALRKMANNLPELPPCTIAAAIRARENKS